MRKSIPVDVNVKRRPGRPATGTDPEISARVPPAMRDEIEALVERHNSTRSNVIRWLLQLGLAAARKKSEK